jgi:hypothetical protein
MRLFGDSFLTGGLGTKPVLRPATFGGHLADDGVRLLRLADGLESHRLVDLESMALCHLNRPLKQKKASCRYIRGQKRLQLHLCYVLQAT